MKQEKTKTKKPPKYELRLVLLYIGSIFSLIAPLATLFIIRRDVYIMTPEQSVKLCIGGVMIAVFVILMVMDRLKMPPRIILCALILIMSYLFQSILNDLVLISGLALVGELIDLVFFRTPIKKTKEAIMIGKTADATASQVEDVLKKYIGNGRV